MFVDPATRCAYLYGTTYSSNFGPLPSPHGFATAICEGNYMWGKYYYNTTFQLLQIDGAKLHKKGSSVLAEIGLANGYPVLMMKDAGNGTVLSAIEIKLKEFKKEANYFTSNALTILEKPDGSPVVFIAFQTAIRSTEKLEKTMYFVKVELTGELL